MNGKDLLSGLGFVEDELIQEAEQKKIKKSSMKFFLPMAASFAVAVTAFSIWINHQGIPPILPNGNHIPPVVREDEPHDNKKHTLYFNDADGGMAASLYIKGHFWESLSPEQADNILPLISDKYGVEGIVNYSYSDGATTVFNINTNVKIAGNQYAKIQIAPNEIAKCYTIAGEPTLSEIEGINIEAGIFKTDKNSQGKRNYIYYADFKLDDIAYYVEFTGGEHDEAFFTSIVAEIVLGGKADLSIFNPVVPELRDDRLTEDEAYAEMDFGRYLPKIPSNYQFNDATRFINQESDLLVASWSNGYDDISISISNLQEDDKERIVSTNDTELYDMSLYPIPWVDSMPRDKAHIIENPIFKIDELTLDAIKMRGYTRNDSGDTDSINMRFSVLYDNVVVEVSGEGISPESLFDRLFFLPR